MIIDKKIYDLIEYLVTRTEPKTITKVAQDLNQNRRVIYYNLDKINEELAHNKIEKIVNKTNFGLSLTDEQKSFLKNLMKNYDETTYFMNIDERKLFISTLIAAYPEKITIDFLIDVCFVSRNTIVNDLKDIKSNILASEYNVSLEVTKKQGYFIMGDSLDKIQYSYYLINEVYLSNNDKLKVHINKVFSKNLVAFSEEFSKNLAYILKNNINVLGKTISVIEEKKFTFAFPYILYSNRKSDSINKLDTTKHPVTERIEYKFISELIKKIEEKYDLGITRKEKILLSIIVLSLRKDLDMHNGSDDYKLLKDNINTFVNIFENNAGVKFTNRATFIDKLVTHFKSLLVRKKYNIVTNNTLSSKIINNYKDIYLMTKLSIKYMENFYDVKFTASDVAYVSLHFGSELINSRQKIQKIKRVLIVTDESYSIRSLIEKQCKYYLTNCIIVDVVDVNFLENYHDIDFIVTTNFLETTIPYVKISPLITAEDISKIMNFMSSIKNNKKFNELDKKIDKLVLEYMGSLDKTTEFSMKLKKLIKKDFVITEEDNIVGSSLKDVINEDRIIVSNKISSLEEGIDKLGGLLIEKSSINDKYIDTIKKEISSGDKYLSLVDGVILLGTKSIKGVTKADIAMLYLEEPFVQDDSSYNLIFLVATSSNFEHVQILYDIDMLLNEHKFLEICSKEKDKNKLYQYIVDSL